MYVSMYVCMNVSMYVSMYYVCIYVCIYVFITEGFFEVAIESWPEWDLNPQQRYQAMSSTRTQSQLCTAIPILLFVQCQVSYRSLPSSVTTFF